MEVKMKKLVLIALCTINAISAQKLTNKQKADNLITNLHGLGITEYNINVIKNAIDKHKTIYETFSDDIRRAIPNAQYFYNVDKTNKTIINKNSNGQITVKITSGNVMQAYLLYAIDNQFELLDLTEKVYFETPESWLEWISSGFDDMANW